MRCDNFPLGIYPPSLATPPFPPPRCLARTAPLLCCTPDPRRLVSIRGTGLRLRSPSLSLASPLAPSFSSILSLPSSVCVSTLLSESASPNTRLNKDYTPGGTGPKFQSATQPSDTTRFIYKKTGSHKQDRICMHTDEPTSS